MTTTELNDLPIHVVELGVWGCHFKTEEFAEAFEEALQFLSPEAARPLQGVEEVLTGLYASEINLRLEAFWDGGWTWYLGDEMNGFLAMGTAKSLATAVRHGGVAAAVQYPQSDWALAQSRLGINKTESVEQVIAGQKESCFFVAGTIAEDYLQGELRRLHAAINNGGINV